MSVEQTPKPVSRMPFLWRLMGRRSEPVTTLQEELPCSILPKDNLADALAAQFDSWHSGIGFELEFWERWFATRGAEWPEDFERRLKPDDPVESWLASTLPAVAQILDVGSGPMTKLGKSMAGRPLSITAVDPLAPFYDEIAARHAVERPVRTVQGFAEDLTALFEPNAFDAAFCTNALDHSFDPIRGIEEMLIVTRIGGMVILEHAANEAETENYEGFHQWNFDIRNGEFVVWNRERETAINAFFAPFAKIETWRNGSGVTLHLTKTRELPIDIHRRRKERLQTVLTNTLRWLTNVASARPS